MSSKLLAEMQRRLACFSENEKKQGYGSHAAGVLEQAAHQQSHLQLLSHARRF